MPKGRPRATRQGRIYTPAKTRNYERRVGIVAALHIPGPLTGWIQAKIWISLPMTKSGSERLNGGDLDNYAKSILDGLQGVAFIDDKQISRLTVERVDGGLEGWAAVDLTATGQTTKPPEWAE